MSPLAIDRSVQDPPVNGRQSARDGVAIISDIRVPGGGRYKVKILDLSQTGFRMECIPFLPEKRAIFLTIPGFAQLEAQIAWRSEWIYGCQFSCPLHPAIYDHIVNAHPALSEVDTH